MYQINDFISYGKRGVCRISDITTLDISGRGCERSYYCLVPLANSWDTIYTPIDNTKDFKPLVSREEAIQILEELPKIEALPPMSRFQLEQTYKQIMQENDPRRLIQLIKYLRSIRLQQLTLRKKVNSSVQRYLAEAKRRLLDTLCIPLGQETKQLEQTLTTLFA